MKATGISNTLELGSSKIPSIDPFHNIDPMILSSLVIVIFWQFAMSQLKNLNYYAEAKFKTVMMTVMTPNDSDDSEWEETVKL